MLQLTAAPLHHERQPHWYTRLQKLMNSRPLTAAAGTKTAHRPAQPSFA